MTEKVETEQVKAIRELVEKHKAKAAAILCKSTYENTKDKNKTHKLPD